MEAAEHWARGGRDDGKQLSEDASVLGVNVPEQEEEEEQGEFGVDPDNWAAVETFLRCSTQWCYGSMGDAIGLKYEAVESVLNMTQPRKHHRELFAALRIMERAALDIMNSTST